MSASAFAGIGDSSQVNDGLGIHFGRLVATGALAVGRAFCVVFFSAIALLQVTFIRSKTTALRARWLHNWCRFACRVLGLSLASKGPVPRAGLMVCNHLSYLDVIALSALAPSVFVAKREVRSWPLFGWLAGTAGTIFVDRDRRAAAGREIEEIRDALDLGLLVVLFPREQAPTEARSYPSSPPCCRQHSSRRRQLRLLESTTTSAVAQSQTRSVTGEI